MTLWRIEVNYLTQIRLVLVAKFGDDALKHSYFMRNLCHQEYIMKYK